MSEGLEQSIHQLLLKVNCLTDFLSGYLSVAANNLEPNASILTYSSLFWDLKGTRVISSHLCGVLVWPLQSTTLLCLKLELAWTTFPCIHQLLFLSSSLHPDPSLSFPLTPYPLFLPLLFSFFCYFFLQKEYGFYTLIAFCHTM